MTNNHTNLLHIFLKFIEIEHIYHQHIRRPTETQVVTRINVSRERKHNVKVEMNVTFVPILMATIDSDKLLWITADNSMYVVLKCW